MIVKITKTLSLAFFYLKEVIKSNLQVAIDVLTPSHRMTPAMIDVPVEDLTSRQVVALSHLITMTPGSLSVDYDESSKNLTVHCMYVDSPEDLIKHFRNEYIERIRYVF